MGTTQPGYDPSGSLLNTTILGPVPGGSTVAGPFAVRDPRTGAITGYQDAAGQDVAPPQGSALAAQQQAQRQSSATKSYLEQEASYDAIDKQVGNVWVDGQLRTVALNPDGSIKVDPKSKQPVYVYSTPTPSKDGALQPGGTNGTTAYDALNFGMYGLHGGFHPTDPFVMSMGQQLDENGQPITGPTAGQGTNMMTLAGGVQWLLNLATQHPDQYNSFVTLLKHAGYTNGGAPLVGGRFSEDVAVAGVQAMKDLSLINSTPGGAKVDLNTFLNDKVRANADAAAALYQPVNRNMTDPASVASAAKTAAEQLIGRNLTPEELAQFQSHFAGMENSAYDAIDTSGKAQAVAKAMGESAPGANVTMPNAAGEAESALQGDQFSQERANYSAQEYTQGLLKLFGVQ